MQPDTLIPDPSNPQAWNRYSYVGNRPINFNDPTGHCADGITTVICAVVAGAVIGAASSYISQVVTNVNSNGLSVSAFANVDKRAIAGAAVAGAVGAAVGVAGAILGAGLAATVAVGGASGLLGGMAGRGTLNLLSNKSFFDGYTAKDAVLDTATGAAFAGVGWGITKAIRYFRGGATSNNAYTHDYEYSDRVRVRGVEDPKGHNFPYSFDDEILQEGAQTVTKKGYRFFKLDGTLNGTKGKYEIGMTTDDIIDHRFFRGGPK